LTFGTDRKLYAVALPRNSSQPLLVSLNQASASASVVSAIRSVSATSASSLSLAFGCDDRLWMAASDSNSFWELTPSSGQTRLVGSLGAKITSLAVRDDVLYGFGGNGNANLYRVDPNTGQATLIGPYGAAAPNPVDGAFDADGTLWGLIRNYNDSGNSGLPTELNILAQIDPTQGTMTNARTIADPNSNLAYKSRMRGFAIAPPVCSTHVNPSPQTTSGAPAMSAISLGALGLALLAAACLAFRRRPD
jgi:streptogramin lyase